MVPPMWHHGSGVPYAAKGLSEVPRARWGQPQASMKNLSMFARGALLGHRQRWVGICQFLVL